MRSARLTRWALVVLAFGLTALGIVFIHSAKSDGEESFPALYARKQVVWSALSLIALLVVWRFDYRFFERWAYVLYGALLAVLGVLLLFKLVSRDGGAVRWIRLAFFDVQPSELMKIAVILALARYLRFRADYRRISGLLRPYALTLVPMALVLLQPDLGTSLMLPPILLAMLFIGGARRRHVLLTLGLGLLVLPAAFFLGDRLPILRGYQLERVTAFFRQADPVVRRHEAYQLDQSEVALGNGGLWGRGLGEGSQNTLGHLPAHHTDFIFSVIGEEWGFLGATAVAAVFTLFVYLILAVAYHTREPFGRLVAIGVGVAFAAQVFQNLAMVMGLSPITGLPLPFVSYGGSSLVSSYLALGLVLGVSSQPIAVVASKDLDPRDPVRTLAVHDHRSAGSLAARWPV